MNSTLLGRCGKCHSLRSTSKAPDDKRYSPRKINSSNTLNTRQQINRNLRFLFDIFRLFMFFCTILIVYLLLSLFSGRQGINTKFFFSLFETQSSQNFFLFFSTLSNFITIIWLLSKLFVFSPKFPRNPENANPSINIIAAINSAVMTPN